MGFRIFSHVLKHVYIYIYIYVNILGYIYIYNYICVHTYLQLPCGTFFRRCSKRQTVSRSCKEEYFLQEKTLWGVWGLGTIEFRGLMAGGRVINIYYEGSRMLKYASLRVSRTGSHAQLPPRAKHIARSVHYGSGMISAILRAEVCLARRETNKINFVPCQ